MIQKGLKDLELEKEAQMAIRFTEDFTNFLTETNYDWPARKDLSF